MPPNLVPRLSLLRGVCLLSRQTRHLNQTPVTSHSPTQQLSMSTQRHKAQLSLPAAYYRGGTSRAIIFKTADLPTDRTEWAPIFLGTIGSPDPNGRQLDGLGGGVSSLSKICVIGISERDDADVDYTFAAIGVKNEGVDFTSNCGNMTSAVGAFAVDEGLVDSATGRKPNLDCLEKRMGEEEQGASDVGRDGEVTVRIHNTNTGKIIHSTFPVVDGEAAADGEMAIDGVAGSGAMVKLAFMDPGGSKTGKLLPTGKPSNYLAGVEVTCIDASNPCVFIAASSLSAMLDTPVDGTILPVDFENHASLLTTLETIRRQAAVLMGLASTPEETPGSIPKIAIISPPRTHKILSGDTVQKDAMDMVVRAVSVGQPHRAIPITVAMAVAAAAEVEGTVVWKCLQGNEKRVSSEGIVLGHASGKIVVGAEFDNQGWLEKAVVYRTARRLMAGRVFWK